MAITLLSTKLFIPPRRPRDSVVERSRLTQRLTESNAQRLTLITAPAGFGKTTLLSGWIPHSERCVPWLSLDANDDDPARFWICVIAALQLLQPDLGADALALLQSPQSPPIESVLTLLLNDVAAFPLTVSTDAELVALHEAAQTGRDPRSIGGYPQLSDLFIEDDSFQRSNHAFCQNCSYHVAEHVVYVGHVRVQPDYDDCVQLGHSTSPCDQRIVCPGDASAAGVENLSGGQRLRDSLSA